MDSTTRQLASGTHAQDQALALAGEAGIAHGGTALAWPADAAGAGVADSLYEQALRNGFRGLVFPPGLEAEFHRDKMAERLHRVRQAGRVGLMLALGMLVTDWLMVPDQFDNALRLRVLALAPLMLLWLACMGLVDHKAREWLAAAMTVIGAGITTALCVASRDPLGAPYLVGLTMFPLFNGGVMHLRFRVAVCADVAVVAMFCVANLLIATHPPFELMVSGGLVLMATALFNLYGSYWLEHEERANWLMLKHEQQLLQALQEGNRRLDEIARHDALTGLANRRHFDEFLQGVWQRARAGGTEVALLAIDVDHFKAYNDAYGHPEGDRCLQDVAEAMMQCLRRPGDLVARVGGEEFVAVLAGQSLPVAMAAAERVREAVLRLGHRHDGAPSGRVTVSIGVAATRADAPGAGIEALIACADQALYRAKADGRNAVRAASSSPADGPPRES